MPVRFFDKNEDFSIENEDHFLENEDSSFEKDDFGATRHVARTVEDADTYGWRAPSVHLSFSVDLEPPFDWAGALHIALRLFCLQIEGAAAVAAARAGAGAGARTGAPVSKRQRTGADGDGGGQEVRPASALAEFWTRKSVLEGEAERKLHEQIDRAASAPTPEGEHLRGHAFCHPGGGADPHQERQGWQGFIKAALAWKSFSDWSDRACVHISTEDDDSLAWLRLIESDGEPETEVETAAETARCLNAVCESSVSGSCESILSDRGFLRLAFLKAVLVAPEATNWREPRFLGQIQAWFARVEKAATAIAVKLARGRDGAAQALAAVTGSVLGS